MSDDDDAKRRRPAQAEARRAVYARFRADLARRYPGTSWHIITADEATSSAQNYAPASEPGTAEKASKRTKKTSSVPNGTHKRSPAKVTKATKKTSSAPNGAPRRSPDDGDAA